MSSMLPTGMTLGSALTNHTVFNDIINKVIDVVKNIDNHETLKNHPEIINLVCDTIEYFLPSNKYKFDKKQIAIRVLDTVYSLNDDEKKDVETQIQFIYNNKLIKPTPFYKIIWGYITSFFKMRT